MRTRLLLLTLLCPLMMMAEQKEVKSPDGRLTVKVSVENGIATYGVTYDGIEMLKPSRLGLRSSFGDYSEGLSYVKDKEEVVEKHYDISRTKTSHVDFKANRLDMTLKNEHGQQLVVTFLVANNDIAFQYTLLRQWRNDTRSIVIEEEETSFRLPDETTAFLSPQSDAMIGFAQTKPSYEEVYSADAPMAQKSLYGHGYVFPALFHVGNKGWVLISETGVTSAYVGSHLSDYDEENGYTIAYPMKEENNGIGSTSASIALPASTPWRTITVGKTLKPIVETTIPFDPLTPLYEPSQAYQPGRYTWSWLIWQDESCNYDDQVTFIDLAAKMGYEYCLVDAWWDTNIGRDKIADLSRYAQSKGVSLLLWYNSNGHANNAPQGPFDCMNTNIAREREMAWMKSIGVKGIKVDFFGGDKQQTLQLYEDILSDANKYGLQCVFHGCTLPRGWERLYPNYVASEAVLASENVFFDPNAAIREPFDLTLHPFCRNAVASMDWGGTIMNRFMSKDNKSRHPRKTTDMFEIASAITVQTSVQCMAIQPNNLKELPKVELDLMKSLPTTWDETRLIDGYPGKYVVLARRHGNQWYIAGLNGEKAIKRLTLQLPMLAGKTVSYYTDNVKGYGELKTLKVDKKGQAKVVIQPNGGIILR
ncbi:MAG: glycoside hydrolase family 97 catalytic domain-containing protein [Prevotella sp.]|nr:glycoside hydrolase family 97 catalytic domain-containing protein [Prevotella sp.]